MPGVGSEHTTAQPNIRPLDLTEGFKLARSPNLLDRLGNQHIRPVYVKCIYCWRMMLSLTKLHNIAMNNAIWAYQKTEYFKCCWLCANAGFDVTYFSTFVGSIGHHIKHSVNTLDAILYQLHILL